MIGPRLGSPLRRAGHRAYRWASRRPALLPALDGAMAQWREARSGASGPRSVRTRYELGPAPVGRPALPAPTPLVVPAEDREAARRALSEGFDVRRVTHERLADRADRSAHPPPRVAVVAVDDGLAERWDALAGALGLQPYARPGWFRAWAFAFTGGPPTAVTIHRQGELVGVVPVVARGRRLRSATNRETPWFRPVLADPGDMGPVLTELSMRWRRLSLEYVPVDDPVVPVLDGGPGAESGAASVLRRAMRHSPFVPTLGDYQSYLAGRISASRQKSWRRHDRRAAELGEVSFELVAGGADLDSRLREGFGLEARGWKAENGTAVLCREDATRFYWEASRWADQLGLLRLGFLRLGGRPAAFAHTLVGNGVMSVTKLAFDPELSECAPGIMLVRRLLEHCFENPRISRFDFLGEFEAYKRVFTDESEAQLHLEVFLGLELARARRGVHGAAWAMRDELRQRIPLRLREQVDTSNPTRALRTGLAAARRTRTAGP